jgi:hypothetical protein
MKNNWIVGNVIMDQRVQQAAEQGRASEKAPPRLSELLGLPSGLSDAERGACISVANYYGAEAAQAEARKILAKHP